MNAKRLCLLAGCLSVLNGCLDATGFEEDCSGEMQSVRRREGGPPVSRNGPNETGGNYTETWRYDSGFYVFRWGISYPSCQTSGPIQADLLPV